MSMSKKKLLMVMPLVALVSACAQQGAHPVTQVGLAPGARADVNPSYRAGQLSIPDIKTPSLQDMQDLKPASKEDKPASDEDRLRLPAMRDSALSYGARGGLAWSSKQINEMLKVKAGELTRTYSFESFLIKGPGGVTVLPPVISESRDTYEQFDAGRALRVADNFYEIIEQARFAPVAPLWHSYLIRSYTAPTAPPDGVLPKSDGERDLWKKFVAEGWEHGVRQSGEIFQADLRRLDRDFLGMVRYSELLEKGQVSAPVIADANLGVTGNGQDMRINDRALRITADPKLNVHNPVDWRAAVSNPTPSEAATPPGDSVGIRTR